MSQQVQYFNVSEDERGQRLDNYLLTRLKGVPKSAIYRVIRKGQVRVNKGRVKPERKLVPGDVVRVPPLKLAQRGELPKPSRALSESLRERVLFDQDGLLIIDKPSGLAVHGGSGVNLGMVEALRQLPENSGFIELVHRLDKETSGCVMVARKRSVLKKLQEALRLRGAVRKRYIALVCGEWPAKVTRVEVPLKRIVSASGERFVKVQQDGKPSTTEFNVLQRFAGYTLVEAFPITGRTHQIRVHAQYVGCPLVGDAKYAYEHPQYLLAQSSAPRLFLHAAGLTVQLDAPLNISLEAPFPANLQAFIDKLNEV